jgi:uncharacterized membrane protein YsdA (DUF1294 family)
MEINNGIGFVSVWLIAASLLGFALMGVDKQRAKNHAWRISERTLLFVAFIGGGIGSLAGMLLFRHKTKHMKFIVLVPLAMILNILVAILLIRFI